MKVRVQRWGRSSEPKVGQGRFRGMLGASADRWWVAVEAGRSRLVSRRKKVGEENDWDVGSRPIWVFCRRQLVPKAFSVKQEPPTAAEVRLYSCTHGLGLWLFIVLLGP
jgi:hypothetical protein